MYQQAVKAGGATVSERMDMSYGDRSGGVKDPSGNSWFIITHKEDVAAEELKKRAENVNKSRRAKLHSRAGASLRGLLWNPASEIQNKLSKR